MKEGDRRGKTGRRVQRIEVGGVRRRGEGELERIQRIEGEEGGGRIRVPS